MDQEKTSKGTGNPSSNGSEGELERNLEVEEFFKRLMDKQDMRRPKPSPEAMAEALQAIHRLGLGSGSKGQSPPTDPLVEHWSADLATCDLCGYHNQDANQFCGMCGAPLGDAQPGEPGETDRPRSKGGRPEGQHHYHHHYHHHYVQGQGSELLAAALGQRAPAPAGAGKESVKLRAPLGGPALSRAEATLRQMTQDWALASNNKQLDDLLAFYASDALVLRPNVPPVRGTSAIREFFFAALDAGLGDIELEPLRVEFLGDVAYEVGRCRMLVPVAVSKRREERGKYVVVFAKQAGGEWKAVVDCWSSDLNLNVTAEPPPAKASPLASPPTKPRH